MDLKITSEDVGHFVKASITENTGNLQHSSKSELDYKSEFWRKKNAKKTQDDIDTWPFM